MILVTLGTQDKDFSRLLKAVEREVKKGTIKEEVIVQSGFTKYKSSYMKIIDFVTSDELDKLVEECDLLITHGGVGSIVLGLKHKKKIIAAARLKKYKEHTNDHQLQIINEFSSDGYIVKLRDFSKILETIKMARKLKPKKYESNKDNFVSLIDNTILGWERDGTLDKSRKFREIFLYLIFGGLTTLINIAIYFILARLFNINYQFSNVIAWIVSVLFAFITNKLFVFSSKNKSKKENLQEISSFLGFRILSLGIDVVSMYLFVQLLTVDDMISKVIANIIVVVANYVFSKLFIFRKK